MIITTKVMKENTNSAIVYNSIALYIRLLITSICGLATTRFALQALGANDYGLFSVIGGIISFIAIINTIMSGTSNRFIATAIGKGDMNEANRTFNVNFIIHFVIALGILFVSIPIGDWYIYNYVHYDGDLRLVVQVFRFTIIGSVVSIIGVPFNGLLLARERFILFSFIDIISSIMKLIIAYLLINHFDNKLLIYAASLSFLSAYPTLIYYIYCKNNFSQIVKWNFVRESDVYKKVLGFSIWVGYGAIATVGKSQGSSLLVNAFFSTIMNTALGIANIVNGILLMFASSVTKSISPQITKNYAAGNYERSENLAIMASKISYMIMLCVSVPFIVAADYIFEIWLGSIPNYVVIFTHLIIVDALIGSLNAGIPELVFAMGNIKWYQLIVNTLFLLSIVVGYIVLKAGAPAYSLIITYIIFSLIVLVVRQIILNKLVKINNWRLIRQSYIPSLVITATFLCLFLIPINYHPSIKIGIAYIYLLIIILLFGLKRQEKKVIFSLIKSVINK